VKSFAFDVFAGDIICALRVTDLVYCDDISDDSARRPRRASRSGTFGGRLRSIPNFYAGP
jgi:hypothetical protein